MQIGISYMEVNASDDVAFRILEKCLEAASEFITAAHSRGAGVLVHCMAGVNRFCHALILLP
jgi:protein-tyrosine phosphatase